VISPTQINLDKVDLELFIGYDKKFIHIHDINIIFFQNIAVKEI